jgi:hypothetical protein
MSRRQHCQPALPGVEDGVPLQDERASPFTHNGRKGAGKVVLRGGPNNKQLLPERARCHPHFLSLVVGRGIPCDTPFWVGCDAVPEPGRYIRFNHLRRRGFTTPIGGMVAAWPRAACAQ